jgi:hypothetical protein
MIRQEIVTAKDVILTDKEWISFLQTEVMKRDRIIADYERQIVNQVNHIFELGKEIDGLTEFAFESPMLHRRERKV